MKPGLVLEGAWFYALGIVETNDGKKIELRQCFPSANYREPLRDLYNCHAFSLRGSNYDDGGIWSGPFYIVDPRQVFTVSNGYKPVPILTDRRPGDIIVFSTASGKMIHSCVVKKVISFAK